MTALERPAQNLTLETIDQEAVMRHLGLNPRDAARIAQARAQGYTATRCDECGEVRSLAWLGGDCNETDYCDWTCSGVYRLHC